MWSWFPFSEVEKITADEIGKETETPNEQESANTDFAKTEEKRSDSIKMDLSQFENQDDDFNTIMDGLIQETTEENDDVGNLNYLQDLQTPVEIESDIFFHQFLLLFLCSITHGGLRILK